ncbi:nucleotidyltransferase domain-containing protein [Methylobacterium currus]|nr:nucleotidyltransferase domain-containing protein [Methylobacterium currus]UHC13822.1 nucleotidyltransferase domain-containing protein [Methylobacterium currus]
MLFGSRARGTHDDDSDADLAVILSVRPASAAGSPARWRRSPSS